MAKQCSSSSRKKDKHRVRNWREYNQSLVNRGSITFWFREESVQNWYSSKKTGKRGHPEVYADNPMRSYDESSILWYTPRITGTCDFLMGIQKEGHGARFMLACAQTRDRW